MKDPFIKTYDIFDKEYCQEVIDAFNHSLSVGVFARRCDEVKKDIQLEMHGSVRMQYPTALGKEEGKFDLRQTELATRFFPKIQECIKDYVDSLGLKGVVGDVYAKSMLVQRSAADEFEAYSTWHCENANNENSDRAYVYMLYLNDDYDGGDTQFLFQKHAEEPKTGKVVIFPAGYTHTHRGDMVKSGVKYIATGWTFWMPGI